ncbi:MAG: hypothetical protein WC348_03825 [Patescibacteria group bacterium]|jgi:hypothetical protein
MAKIERKSKKIVRKNSRRKEVEIPVFVINKKEEVFVSEVKNVRTAEEKDFGIVKDRDDLPVFQNFSTTVHDRDDEEKIEEKLRDERARLKNAMLKKDDSESVKEEKKSKKQAPLSEPRKRIIMWTSVAVLACLIFFMWLSSLKNNFSEFFGSASYTFSRTEEVFEEVEGGVEELNDQTAAPEETPENTESADGGVLDQIKEKILVEGLKSKLE